MVRKVAIDDCINNSLRYLTNKSDIQVKKYIREKKDTNIR